MTPNQSALYFRKWGEVRAWLLACDGEGALKHLPKARQTEELEALRKGWTHQASNGRTASSRDMSNGDLTRWLALCDSLMGDDSRMVAAEIKAAAEDNRGDKRWQAIVREALRLSGKPEGYAVAIVRKRRRVHLGSVADFLAADCQAVLAPLLSRLSDDPAPHVWRSGERTGEAESLRAAARAALRAMVTTGEPVQCHPAGNSGAATAPQRHSGPPLV